MLESMTRHVVEQIQLARDFDACEGKGPRISLTKRAGDVVVCAAWQSRGCGRMR
jgi:hypothetical protein